MQAVIYIFQCPKGRVYAGWRSVPPEALRTWPNRGVGPLPCGYTGSGNPWCNIARRHRAALVWRILARVDGTRADVDAAEVRAIRLARAVFGNRCKNVLSGGQGMSSDDARALNAPPEMRALKSAASKAHISTPSGNIQLARAWEASKTPEARARRSASGKVAQNRPEVKAAVVARRRARAATAEGKQQLARCTAASKTPEARAKQKATRLRNFIRAANARNKARRESATLH